MHEALSKDRRARNFATVVYPESAPEDWLDTLKDQHICAFVSPLHDKDVDRKTGLPKKPHYHVMVMFDGKKSREQVSDLFALIGGVGLEIVGSLRGYARYLCHLDDPEKTLYDFDQVTQIAGANYAEVIGLAIDKRTAIAEMQDFCISHNINEFADLMDYTAENKPEWHHVLCTCGTMVMRAYLDSRRHKAKIAPTPIADNK